MRITGGELLSHLSRRRSVRFIAVGSVGFLIEAALLSLVLELGWATPVSGRLWSFPVAVVATWWLNRRHTFASAANPTREIMRYFVAQIAGALANLGAYLAAVSIFPTVREWPVLGLAIGAIAGLLVNYALSAVWVFRNRLHHG